MKLKKYFLLFLLVTSLHTFGQVKIPPMPNKSIWKDTKGNPIRRIRHPLKTKSRQVQLWFWWSWYFDPHCRRNVLARG